MSAIQQMINIMRDRSDVVVIDCEQSWRLSLTKDSDYLCDVTIPHEVLEWYASVKQSIENKELWSDWMDYSGYDKTPKSKLEQSMANDIERFVDRLFAEPLIFPLVIYKE